MTAVKELGEHLKRLRSAPFLFVGSGLARRYLNLPDWEGLLREVAALTPHPYGYFVTAADGQLPAIATAIGDAIIEPWWTDANFEESRKEFGDSLTKQHGPLKVEVARIVREAMASIPTRGEYADELELLSKAVIDGVITTNYDSLLENVFVDYQQYVGQDELLFAETQGVGEIYKIHGDVSAPESIVLTEADFKSFNDRNPYLAAKLLTIFIEHPVVFIGYSLQDPDVTNILVSIAKVLSKDNLAKLEGNLILVDWDPDIREAILERGVVTADGFSIPVKILRMSSFGEFFAMLGTLKRKFPAPILRRLKQHVYELVRSNQPSDRLYVADIDSAQGADIDVVFGVGLEARLGERGYRGLERIDLLMDVLQPASQYNARRIVDESLPQLLKQPGLVPIYRYLREAGLLKRDGTLSAGATVDQKVAKRIDLGSSPYLATRSQQPRAKSLVAEAGTLTQLISKNSVSHAILAATALPLKASDLDELRDFLLSTSSVFASPSITDRANWARLVCLYDFLRFGVFGS